MIDGYSARGVLAINDSGVVAVLQNDGTVKTWGSSASAQPVATLPFVPGVKAIFPCGNDFAYLLESGSMYRVNRDSPAIVPVTYFVPFVAPPAIPTDPCPGGYIPNALAFMLVTGGTMYVNDAHEFVCLDAKQSGKVPACLFAPYFMAGIQHGAANDDVVILVKDDGTLTGWGNDIHGLLTFPAGLTGVAKIQVGAKHAVALKIDGTVEAWGDNSLGQTTIPSGTTGIVEISAYALGDFTLARKSDGTIKAWGDDSSGQCMGAASISGATRVSAGKRHAVALAGTTAHAWGHDNSGSVSSVNGLTGIADIAAGDDDTCTIDASAHIGYFGTSLSPSSTFKNGENSYANWTKVWRQADAIIGEGTLKGGGTTNYVASFQDCWPASRFGRIVRGASGMASGEIRWVFFETPPAVTGFNAAACPVDLDTGTFNNIEALYGCTLGAVRGGYSRSDAVWAKAIDGAGTEIAWGLSDPVMGSYGATSATPLQYASSGGTEARVLDDGTVQARGADTSVPAGIDDAVGIAATGDGTLFVLRRSGKIAVWGASADDYTSLSAVDDAVAIATTGYSTALLVILHRDRTISIGKPNSYPAPYAFASPKFADAAVATSSFVGATLAGDLVTNLSTGGQLPTVPPGTVQKLQCFEYGHFAAENADGTLSEWSTGVGQSLGAFSPAFQPTLTTILDYAGNDTVTLAVVAQSGISGGGAVVAWGPDADLLDIPDSLKPGAPGLAVNPAVKVACGADHYMVLLGDGSIIVFGDNTSGEISAAPTGNGFTAIAAGYRCCMAMNDSNVVTAWGASYVNSANGQTATAIASHPRMHGGVLLKDGNAIACGFFASTTGFAPSPDNPSWTDVVKLSVNYQSVVGLTADGTVRQWKPHFANGTDSGAANLPTMGAQVTACATKDGGFAVDAAGAVTAWGADPRWPVAHSDVVKVSYKDGGSVLWFLNSDGTLGNGGNDPLVPPPANLSNVTAFDYGFDSVGVGDCAAAVLSDGSLKTWGSAPALTPAGSVADVRAARGKSDIGSALMVRYADGSVEIATDLAYSALQTIPSGATGVTQIEFWPGLVPADKAFAATVNGDGTVSVWGDTGAAVLAVPAGLTGVSKIAIGTDHIVALKSDHSVAAWGTDSGGCVSSVNGAAAVADIACGDGVTTLVYLDGTVAVYPEPVGGVSDPMGLSGSIPSTGSVGSPFTADLDITGAFTPPASLDAGSSTVPSWLGVTFDGPKMHLSGTPSGAEDDTIALAIEDSSSTPQRAVITQVVSITDPNGILYIGKKAIAAQSPAGVGTKVADVAGAEVGDVALVAVHTWGTGVTHAAGAGVTPIFQNKAVDSVRRTSLYLYKFADTSNHTICTISASGGTWNEACVAVFRNIADSIDVLSTDSLGSAGTELVDMPANGITTTATGDLCLYLGAAAPNALPTSGAAISAPADYTLINAVAGNGSNNASAVAPMVMAYKIAGSAGAVSGPTGQYDSGNAGGAHFGAWLVGVKFSQPPMTLSGTLGGGVYGNPYNKTLEIGGHYVEPVTVTAYGAGGSYYATYYSVPAWMNFAVSDDQVTASGTITDMHSGGYYGTGSSYGFTVKITDSSSPTPQVATSYQYVSFTLP